MNHLNYILSYLLLISIAIIPVYAQPEAEQANSSHPVWAGMKPTSTTISTVNDTDTNQGFVEPPPADRLNAKIIASSASVQKGESINFTIESNQSSLKYYWVSGDLKSSQQSLVVDTSLLKPGKHRVRATITNEQREQAHASLFFIVLDAVANDDDNLAAQTDTSKVIELPGVSTDPTPPVSADTDNAQSAATSGSESVQDNTNNQQDSKVLELPSAPSVNTKNGVQIDPQRLTITRDETAVFTTNTSADDGYRYLWKFTDKRGDQDHFEIRAENLKSLEPGSYLVHLTVIRKDNTESKAQATLVVREEADESINVPNLLGKQLDEIKEILNELDLQLGTVRERTVETGQGTVLDQAPEAGGNVTSGTAIDVVIGVASIPKVPNLLGRKIADAKELLTESGFDLGEITSKIDDNAIDRVIDQSPKADSSLDKGSSINLVVGKPTPKPLKVTIQPSSTVTESGSMVELSAIFINPVDDNGITYSWRLDDVTADESAFKIDTSALSLGEHTVTLDVTDSSGRQASSSATLTLNAKKVQVPDLLGESAAAAQSALEQVGLKLGDVQQKPGNVKKEQVLEQSPSAGERIAAGSSVQLILATPKSNEQTSISLSVDNETTNKTVKVGEVVVFQTKLQPEPQDKDKDVHYVYTINAQKKANVQPVLEWTADKEGIYSVVVTAFNESGILAKSSPLTLTVTPLWELPAAKIVPEMQVISQGDMAEFVSTSTYDLNTTLDYEWSTDTDHGGSKKQFAFDTTKIAPGSYSIKLQVADTQKNKSRATAMLVIQAAVETTNSVSGTTDSTTGQGDNIQQIDSGSEKDKPVINLSATRRFVSTDTPIRIKAISDKPLTSAYYYFEPGDERNTKWLESNEITHTYNGFGTYLVRAAVKQKDSVLYSDSITIWVWSPLLLLFTAGIGLFSYIVMWWWTKRIPTSKKKAVDDLPRTKPLVIEEQIPLQSDENDIVTESRLSTPDKTVTSVLKKAMLQFILGISISILVLFVILKSVNLI